MAAYRPGGLEDDQRSPRFRRAGDLSLPAGGPETFGPANTEYNYVHIKILTEEGRENANVEILYLSDRTHSSNVRAKNRSRGWLSREF